MARNLERAADQVTNICEWVVFATTGEMLQAANQPVDLYKEVLV